MVLRDLIRAEMAMTDEEFRKLLATIGTLSPAQLVTLDASIRGRLVTAPASRDGVGGQQPGPASAPSADGGIASLADLDAQFAAAPVCPHCQGTKLGKWGHANGLRRYRCAPCGVTFNALTGTPLAQLHKRDLWIGHGQALVEGISLRKVAARLGIDLTTAFRWRHRFLAAPKNVRPERLAGTVEADEIYFLRSEKGSRKLARPARKRGGKAKKRGLSDEQVPVLIARDHNAATTDRILADRSQKSIEAVLGPVIDKSAILVSDWAQAYRAFANEASILHVALNLSAGERRWGVYHVQNVNNYDSRLKGWMRRFNGVATKYLDTYLGWHRANDREGSTLNASRVLRAAWG
jgi:transposase-like protein